MENNYLINKYRKNYNAGNNIQKIRDLWNRGEYGKIEKMYNGDYIKKIILKPKKVGVRDTNIINKHENEMIVRPINLKKYWEKRTNKPYKAIHDANTFDKIVKDIDDLIIHKITNIDKNKYNLLKKYKKFMNDVKNHNNSLTEIYSQSELSKHKKKFNYGHKYSNNVEYTMPTHMNLKQQKINHQREEKKRLDNEKKEIENIINIFTKDKTLDEISAELNKL